MPYESYSPILDFRHKVRQFKHDQNFKDIQKNSLRTGSVYVDPYFSTSLDSGKAWARPYHIRRSPEFIDGKPDRFDALQGKLGDCWLIAAMEAITLNDELAKFVIPRDQEFDRNYVGAFHFRLWQLGVWYDVVVDDQLPVNKENWALCYAHSRNNDVFWAALLEKAYAKFTAVTGQKARYEDLKTGVAVTSLQDLTGGIVETVKLHKPPSGITINWLLQQVSFRDALMVCYLDRQTEEPLGIMPHHGYTITKIFKFPEDYDGLFLVRLLNPWGNTEWEGWWSDDYYRWGEIDRSLRKKLEVVERDDGEFWMDERDLTRRFEYLFICHLEPNQYLKKHKINPKFRTWSTLTFYGEWVKYVSAMGNIVSSRYKNPQYMFKLEAPKHDLGNYSQKYNTVIDVTQRSKDGRKVKTYVAFYIYVSSHFPLSYNDIMTLVALDTHPDYQASWGRTYVQSFSLRPGNYVIIPSTLVRNSEANFMVRVFSEGHVQHVATHVNQISKSMPIEERINIKYNATRMFKDSAWGEDGIDWGGLKKLLEVAMNPNCSLFGKFTSFLRYLGELFGINLSPDLFDKYDKGHAVFTKDECRSMIAMLDDDKSGKLSISEFCNLWNKICFWTKVYDQHKDDEEGYLKLDQLREALSAIGYNVTQRTVHSLSYIYTNEEGLISLTDFILCGVKLETVLSLVDVSDVKKQSENVFTLEEWVKNTLMF